MNVRRFFLPTICYFDAQVPFMYSTIGRNGSTKNMKLKLGGFTREKHISKFDVIYSIHLYVLCS